MLYNYSYIRKVLIVYLVKSYAKYLPYIPSLRERERDETHNTELRETQKYHSSKLRAIEQK